jgi:hypothetical protein
MNKNKHLSSFIFANNDINSYKIDIKVLNQNIKPWQ